MTDERAKRKLTKHETTRSVKLKGLVARLNNGEPVQNRTLKTWLNTQQYDELLTRYEEKKDNKAQFADKPDTIKGYENKLHRALLIYGRADAYSGKGQRKTAETLFNKADTAFERALEFLQEIIEREPNLSMWFDRNTEWSAEADIGLSPVQMPRVITSRSLDTQSSVGMEMAYLTKREIKLDAVKSALDELIYEAEVNEVDLEQIDQSRERLQRLIKRLE